MLLKNYTRLYQRENEFRKREQSMHAVRLEDEDLTFYKHHTRQAALDVSSSKTLACTSTTPRPARSINPVQKHRGNEPRCQRAVSFRLLADFWFRFRKRGRDRRHGRSRLLLDSLGNLANRVRPLPGANWDRHRVSEGVFRGGDGGRRERDRRGAERCLLRGRG